MNLELTQILANSLRTAVQMWAGLPTSTGSGLVTIPNDRQIDTPSHA